jgi:hypothetical protein
MFPATRYPMPDVPAQDRSCRALVPITTDAPRRKVFIINDPRGWPSEWEFERPPMKNDTIAREEDGLFYKVLGSTSCGDLLLESFASSGELDKAFGPASIPINAWLRW